MKKEKYNKFAQPIEAEIDLHGLTEAVALSAVTVFLQTSENKGFSKVRIITGKGSGVLQKAVRMWLQGERIYFETAKINEGGDGAIIITL